MTRGDGSGNSHNVNGKKSHKNLSILSLECEMRILSILLILSACSSQPKVPPFVEGCLYGTISTYYHLMQQPFPQEYLESLYLHCEGAQNGENHSR